MRGALIYGALLAVMLVYGYRTWTREKTSEPALGGVTLWERPDTDLVSIEWKAPKKIVKVERKPEGYWWGSETTIDLKPKKPDAAGSGAGSAGSAAGSASATAAATGSAGSAAGSGAGSAKPPEPEMEEVGRKTREFPLGDAGDKLVKDWSSAHALRDVGTPSEEAKKDYKLDDAKTTLVITFKDGAKTLLVGGSVYGSSDRYALDQASGKAYVLAKDVVSPVELGESSLHLTDPRGFDAAKIGSVSIEAGAREKTVVRFEGDNASGQKQKTWADADTKQPNQTAANFVDNADKLKPTEYTSEIKVADMSPILKLTYKAENGGLLGTLTLYRYEKPGQLPPDQELDPANPPKGETQYYVVTEKTHIPGLVKKDTAQRMENDIDTVLSSKADSGQGSGAGSDAPHSVNPHGNPFKGKTLAPKPPVPGAMPSPAGSGG